MQADQKRERIEGVRVPCRDAKRRVWQAIDLLEREKLRRPRSRSTGSESGPVQQDRDRAAGA
jgi:hypothetical protein